MIRTPARFKALAGPVLSLLFGALLLGYTLVTGEPLPAWLALPTFLLLIVYGTFAGGMRSGLATGAIGLLALMLSLAHPSGDFDGRDWRRLRIPTLLFPTLVLMVGLSKRRLEALIRAEVERDAAVAHARTVEEEVARRTRELAESESKFRAFFERASLGVLIADLPSGRIIAANPVSKGILRDELHEATLASLEAFTHPADHDDAIRQFQELANGERDYYRMEKRYCPREGEVRWMELSLSLARDGEGRPQFAILMLDDVTERREGEEALRRSHALLKAEQEASLDGLIVTDETGKAIAENHRYWEIWGITREQRVTLGTPRLTERILEQVVDPAPIMELWEWLGRHPLESSRDEVLLKDGRALERYTAPVLAPDGQIYGRVWYFRDITERRRLEEALRAQNERLRELDALKNSFVSAVSHELRTPLTSIVGYVEFLEDEIGGTLSDEQKAYVQQIKDGSRRLQHLVDDLLDFARLESGEFKLLIREANLNLKIERALESLRPQARESGLQLESELPEAPIVVRIDPARIEQVLINLIGNAIKFTPPGGRITVVAQAGGSEVRVEVRDSGIGIPAEAQGRLFEKFYQFDPSSTRLRGGTGLGLSISKALVEAHGGRIGVESEPGVGSVFWFVLPRESPRQP